MPEFTNYKNLPLEQWVSLPAPVDLCAYRFRDGSIQLAVCPPENDNRPETALNHGILIAPEEIWIVSTFLR